MQRIDDFSTKQLAELTDDEITKLVDIECAFAGVAFLPELPEAPEKLTVKPTIETYKLNQNEFYFETQADAQEVANLINSKTLIRCSYDYGARGWTHLYKGVDDDRGTICVETELMMDPIVKSQTADVRARYDEKKSVYDEAKEEFDKVMEKREDIARRIHEAIRDARDKIVRKQQYWNNFERHMILAERNYEIALGFFSSAYTNAFDQFPELRQEFEDKYGIS